MPMVILAFIVFTACAGCAVQSNLVPGDSSPAHPRTAESEANGPSALRTKLEALVPRWLEEFGVPSIAITYIEDGELSLTLVRGEQRPGVPVTDDTLYNIASMAKPITAETVLRLVSDGHISLDESLAAHWIDPDIRGNPWHERLTPRLTLSHQTGFPNWRYQTDDVLVFKRQPGLRFGYSGEGYEYVARFLERKLDAEFEELARQYVFDPAGMSETSYTQRDWFEGRIAWPKGREGSYREPTIRKQWIASDDGYSTSRDYAKFIVSVMRRDRVTDEVAEERQMIQVGLAESWDCDPERQPFCPANRGWGLGWAVLEYEDETIVWHAGGDWGESTIGFYIPERRRGAVIFTNGANGARLIPEVVDLLDGDSGFADFLRHIK